MLFYLASRIVSSIAAYLYPGYASFKTLSQRPASEVDLERWLMYWSVLGCIVGVDYVAERSCLLYLALPQTRGSTYIYTAHLRPFFRTHEDQIDARLAQLRAHVYAFVQAQLRALWAHFGAAVGAPQPDPTAHPAHPDFPPPPPTDAGGLGGMVGSFWRAYGPGIIAGGAAMLRPVPAPSSQRDSATLNMDSSAPTSMFYRGAEPTQSVLERRRQLEAELAALSALPVTPPLLTPGASPARSSPSSGDLVNRGARARTDSVGAGTGRFEEVEVPSDGEGYDVRPAPAARGSWFGWSGGSGQGYERVKSD
ncbi:hypothetical protein B0H15DRAFT_947244 [Mycena belliarum]|uniref:Protein YOP1 n=1 Tax=Mycena belliarum TaxID=1033014 RepID=A0AAD6UD03_9AGAR|nr:hypothetical protein B0H15DRAFT_947244 [Mycena belliae]